MPGRSSERSPPSTRSRSPTSTTRCRSALRSGAHGCVVRASTARIWRSRAGTPRRRRPQGLVPRTKPKRSDEQIERELWGAATSVWRVSMAKTRSALDVMGKLHALSGGLSEKARAAARSRRVDRGALRRARCGHVDEASVCVCSVPRERRCIGAADRTGAGRRRLDRHRQNTLTEAGRQRVLTVCSPEYCDLTPAQVWARQLDEVSPCARSPRCTGCWRSLGRTERHRRRTQPATKMPELIARRRNAVWSWDITKLRGPRHRRSCYRAVRDHRYLLPLRLGWMVSPEETGEFAESVHRRRPRPPRHRTEVDRPRAASLTALIGCCRRVVWASGPPPRFSGASSTGCRTYRELRGTGTGNRAWGPGCGTGRGASCG